MREWGQIYLKTNRSDLFYETVTVSRVYRPVPEDVSGGSGQLALQFGASRSEFRETPLRSA